MLDFRFQDFRFHLTTDFTDFTDMSSKILGSQAPDWYGWAGAAGRHLYY